MLKLQRDDIKAWPRRLLHVPSMTSIERSGVDCYGSVRAPAYAILSYTWGRWEVSSGPALSVQGLTWNVPAIDPAHFTVEDFEKVLHSVSNGVSFVWVDIACIDQADHVVKMDEIGRQAAIFNNAQEAYVWLNHISAEKLQGVMAEVFRCEAALGGDGEHKANFGGEDIIIRYNTDEVDDDDDDDVSQWLPSCLCSQDWIQAIIWAFSQLAQDPWFTSLWCLQEGFLRPTATLLSLEAVPPTRPGFTATGLVTLLAASAEIYRVILKVPANDPSYDHTALKHIRGLIEALGLDAWNSPILLYSSAAQFRRTREAVDRIYGIMQVFGFKLGTARDPSRSYTLQELEVQFAIELNALSPVWGQLFRAPVPVELGSCWRVSSQSTLPELLKLAVMMPSDMCRICVEDGKAVFEGQACPFPAMLSIWKKIASVPRKWQQTFWGNEAVQVIILDVTEFSEAYVPEPLRVIDTETDVEKHQDLSQLLCDVLGNELHIFLLGKLLQSEARDEEEDDEVTLSEPEEKAEEVRKEDDKGFALMGMLARRQQLAHQEGYCWQRIGLCIWTSAPKSLSKRHEAVFSQTRGLLA